MDGKIRLSALRGPGTIVGGVVELENIEAGVGWRISGRAMGEVEASFISFEKFRKLTNKYPKLEADSRAGLPMLLLTLLVFLKSHDLCVFLSACKLAAFGTSECASNFAVAC